MTYEKFYFLTEYFFGWRCVTCGEIVDRMILKHRCLGRFRQRSRKKKGAERLGNP